MSQPSPSRQLPRQRHHSPPLCCIARCSSVRVRFALLFPRCSEHQPNPQTAAGSDVAHVCAAKVLHSGMRVRQWSHTTSGLFLAMRNHHVWCRIKPCGSMPGRATLTPSTQRAPGAHGLSKKTSSQHSGRSRHDHLRTHGGSGSTHTLED